MFATDRASKIKCQGRPGKIELTDLRYQRTQFVLSSQRSSEDIQAIRNQASFAKPASGENVSIAAIEQELFEYKAPTYQPIDRRKPKPKDNSKRAKKMKFNAKYHY